MIHVKELVTRGACVYSGHGSDGFRGLVVQYWDGIGRLSMNAPRISRTDEQQLHPGTSAADASSTTMTSAERVGFAGRDDSDEWYVAAVPCEASTSRREGNSAEMTPTERVKTDPTPHSLVINERGVDELGDGMAQHERRKVLSLNGLDRNHQTTELSLFGEVCNKSKAEYSSKAPSHKE